MVSSSRHQSSSAVRRTSPRQVSALVLRRRRSDAASPLSPPVLRRAVPTSLSPPPFLRRTVPTSLPLPPVSTSRSSLSPITVSLPRSFASELVAASSENVTDSAVSPATFRAGGRQTTAAEGVVLPPSGLFCHYYTVYSSYSEIFLLFCCLKLCLHLF